MSFIPECIFLVSGKRKAGKDFISDGLKVRFGDRAVIVRLAGPVKREYAEAHGLDYETMLTAGEYKEVHRKGLADYAMRTRSIDGGFTFCRRALEYYGAEKNSVPIWIVSDCRRKTDLKVFKALYGESTKVVQTRVQAPVNVREQRGFVFVEGIDDAGTECDLDDVSDWDHVVVNDGRTSLEEMLSPLLQHVLVT